MKTFAVKTAGGSQACKFGPPRYQLQVAVKQFGCELDVSFSAEKIEGEGSRDACPSFLKRVCVCVCVRMCAHNYADLFDTCLPLFRSIRHFFDGREQIRKPTIPHGISDCAEQVFPCPLHQAFECPALFWPLFLAAARVTSATMEDWPHWSMGQHFSTSYPSVQTLLRIFFCRTFL